GQTRLIFGWIGDRVHSITMGAMLELSSNDRACRANSENRAWPQFVQALDQAAHRLPAMALRVLLLQRHFGPGEPEARIEEMRVVAEPSGAARRVDHD